MLILLNANIIYVPIVGMLRYIIIINGVQFIMYFKLSLRNNSIKYMRKNALLRV